MITPAIPNPIIWTSQSIRPVLPQISIAITSTVLAIYGSDINKRFKSAIRKQVFVVRVFAFVMLVAFGYGLLNLALARLVSRLLMRSDDLWLSPMVLLIFIAIGVIAEERRQI